MIRLLLIAIGLSLALWGKCQQSCMQQLRAAVDSMQQAVSRSAGGALAAKLEIISEGGPGGGGTNRMITDQVSANGVMVLENDQFCHYEDGRTRVVVIPPARTILVYDQPEGVATRAGEWQQFSDTLWKIGEVSSCRRYGAGSAQRTDVELTIPADVNVGGIASITYSIGENGLIHAMCTRYKAGNKLSSYTIRYLAFEPGRVDPRTKRAPLENVLIGGRLVAKYKDYSVKDKRTKNSSHGASTSH